MDLVMFEQLKQAIFDKDVEVFPHASFEERSYPTEPSDKVILETGNPRVILYVSNNFRGSQTINLDEFDSFVGTIVLSDADIYTTKKHTYTDAIRSTLYEDGKLVVDSYFARLNISEEESYNIFSNGCDTDFENKLKELHVNIFDAYSNNKTSNHIRRIISDNQTSVKNGKKSKLEKSKNAAKL